MFVIPGLAEGEGPESRYESRTREWIPGSHAYGKRPGMTAFYPDIRRSHAHAFCHQTFGSSSVNCRPTVSA